MISIPTYFCLQLYIVTVFDRNTRIVRNDVTSTHTYYQVASRPCSYSSILIKIILVYLMHARVRTR